MQVITAAEFHPQQCNIFAYSSSKGAVRLVDMRSGALLEGRTKPFVCQEQMASARCPNSSHAMRSRAAVGKLLLSGLVGLEELWIALCLTLLG